ncbi:MAG: hypothetical protein FWF82_02525, partial [Oscillospiraceae bacterium]|nr:hypothetical protein [Oscillospiraceae bacterium]
MKKRILSMFIAFAAILCTVGITPDVTAETEEYEKVVIDFNYKEITDSELAEMVENGEIPLNVTYLRLRTNKISDLQPLSVLTELRTLYLNVTQYTSTTSISSKTIISDISDLSPLAGLSKLEYLSISYSQTCDITPLSGLTELRKLHFFKNKIEDFSALFDLPNLNELDIRENPIYLSHVYQIKSVFPNCKISENAPPESTPLATVICNYSIYGISVSRNFTYEGLVVQLRREYSTRTDTLYYDGRTGEAISNPVLINPPVKAGTAEGLFLASTGKTSTWEEEPTIKYGYNNENR